MCAVIAHYWPAFLSGLATTAQLSVFVWTSGCILGSIAGIMLGIQRGLARTILRYVTFGVSSVPAIVALFWVHYPTQYALGIAIDPFVTAALVLSAYNAVAVSSIVANGIEKFPREYLDAALIVGLRPTRILRSIVIPVLMRYLLPPILVSQIAALHTTLFASLISVNELFRAAQRVNSIEYRPIEIFTVLGLFYVLAGLPVLLLSERLVRRYQRDLSER